MTGNGDEFISVDKQLNSGLESGSFQPAEIHIKPRCLARSSDPALVETYGMYIHGWCHTRRFKTWSLLFYLMSLQSLTGMIFRTTNVCCALPLPGIRSGLRLPSIGSEIGSGSRGENERVETFFFFSKTIKKKKKWHSKRLFLSSCIYIYKKKKNHKDLMFKTVRLKRWWNFVSWYRNTFLHQSKLGYGTSEICVCGRVQIYIHI